MRRLSQRESVLLGYSPQKAFPIADTSSEDTDVDFSDVFGGPPRRSSLHEMRFSLGESSDCSGLTSDGDKPVFGDEGLNRRRYQNDKFFDDIFRGNEPLSSSPRRSFRDPFCSSPGSRVLSPARPLPPKAEPFGSSLPAPFSLPAKLSIGMEPPAFGSPTRASNRGKDAAPNGLSNYSFSPLSRSSSQANHDQEESKHEGQSSYHHRALSQEVSCGSEEFSNSIKHGREEGADNSRKDSNGSEVLNSSSQFHFSIYKWASKGVPLSLAFRGGNTSKLKPKDGHERSFRSEGWTGGEGNIKESPSLVSSDDANSVFDKKSGKSFRMGNQMGNDTLSNKSLGDKQQCKTVEEILPTSKLEVSSSSHTVKNIFDGGVSESVQETASDSLLQTDNHDQPGKGIPKDVEEVRKRQGKSLSLLFYENTGCKGNEEIAGKGSQEGNKSKNKKKSSMVPDDAKNFKEDRSKTNVSNEEIGKIWTQGQPCNSGDHGQSNAKGKVKDFVKMFNQESSTKLKLEKVSQSGSSSWKERGASRTENEASTSTTETDKSESMSNMRNRKSSPDVSFKVDGFAHRTARECSTVNDTNHLHADVSKQKNSSTSAAASNGSNNSALDADGSFEESFTIKEIAHDDKKVPHISFKAEELLVIDTKIRQWSLGKQGNIRSLLSTLQYVLWPDSGWKSVPLVDIIEGNAVKRSYQKALLCLHPDKLQQKGATLQQKYTAEKVFDILQDAWAYFSSVGLM